MTKKSNLLLALLVLFGGNTAQAAIPGLSGSTFELSARTGHISTPDGHSILNWGYAPPAGAMQYPGPTLIVDQGQLVTVKLRNHLPAPVSIVFPGQESVIATGGTAGPLTREVPADDGASEVTYTFRANHAGTYMYHSGTNPELQVEMGLVGALIVKPTQTMAHGPRAYPNAHTHYQHEYLFLLTEIDPGIHELVELGRMGEIDMTKRNPVLWFINGRNAPDTMLNAFVPWLPHQPYNSLPRMHPGETLLMRVIGAGHDLHPFHPHGNNVLIIARDGRMLESSPGMGPDLGISDFTIKSIPGQTVDALFTWTGKGLGWDIYGHNPEDPLQPNEYAPDHGKPLPIQLPEKQNLTFGGSYSGSPFLGAMGALPPGEGGLNENGGLFFMWHSHAEKEMVNDDIFPGGMMTMLIIEPPGAPIEH